MKLKTRFRHRDTKLPLRVIHIEIGSAMRLMSYTIELENRQIAILYPHQVEHMKRNIDWEVK